VRGRRELQTLGGNQADDGVGHDVLLSHAAHQLAGG
jgi:hypothetical protein